MASWKRVGLALFGGWKMKLSDIRVIKKDGTKEKFDIRKVEKAVNKSASRVLEPFTPAKSYRDYRNYKQDFVHMLDEVYRKSQAIMYIGDKENSNTYRCC